MKVLTIRQPWTWAIARGHKSIENRSWTTPYRGPLVIHAASKWDDDWEYALCEIVDRIRKQGGELPSSLAADKPYSLPGRVVAVVDLVGICMRALEHRPCGCGVWAMSCQAHWRLENARPVDGPEVRGRLGLWDLAHDLIPAAQQPRGATNRPAASVDPTAAVGRSGGDS